MNIERGMTFICNRCFRSSILLLFVREKETFYTSLSFNNSIFQVLLFIFNTQNME